MTKKSLIKIQKHLRDSCGTLHHMRLLSEEFTRGLFDGEGCIGTIPNKRKRKDGSYNTFYTISIVLTNTNREMVDRFVQSVEHYTGVHMNIHTAPPDKRFKTAQETHYAYKATKKDVLPLLYFLGPLVAKEDQRLLATWFMERSIKDKIHRQDLFEVEVIETIKSLKRGKKPSKEVQDLLNILKGDSRERSRAANWVNSENANPLEESDMLTLSQAGEDFGSPEGAETQRVSSNNNPSLSARHLII
jgi:hypothetical protein